MFENTSIYPEDKSRLYPLIKTRLLGLIDGNPHWLPALANASALLNLALTDINWAGFYLMNSFLNPAADSSEDFLILGPFHGKPACVKIQVGNGVCGTAVARDEIMLVENVHEFPGHIACDCASNSEIVIPLHSDGKVIGVLDIDSPVIGRFDEDDRKGLAEYAKILEQLF